MDNWKARTESGAEYTLVNGVIYIRGSSAPNFGVYPDVFKPWSLQAATVDEDQEDLAAPWISREKQWADVKEPVIGRRLYAAGREQWRISTPIVSVEPVFGDYGDRYDGPIWVTEAEADKFYHEYLANEAHEGHPLSYDEWVAINIDTELS